MKSTELLPMTQTSCASLGLFPHLDTEAAGPVDGQGLLSLGTLQGDRSLTLATPYPLLPT
jgi:hypothetical protein